MSRLTESELRELYAQKDIYPYISAIEHINRLRTAYELIDRLAETIRTAVEMERDRDEESRNFDEERLAEWTALLAEAEGKQG